MSIDCHFDRQKVMLRKYVLALPLFTLLASTTTWVSFYWVSQGVLCWWHL